MKSHGYESDRVRRIGVLMIFPKQAKSRKALFAAKPSVKQQFP